MAKSNYITRQGWLALDQELKFLWKEERPKVTQAVSDAAALGDCIQSLKMRNKETNRDLAEFFGNKWDGFR